MSQPTSYIIGATFGALLGLITFAEGRHRGQQQTGLAGFLACAIAGAFGGLLFILLTMLCFTIAMRAEPRTEAEMVAQAGEEAWRWRKRLAILVLGSTACLMLLAGQRFAIERQQNLERARERQQEMQELNATINAPSPTP